MKEYMEKIGAMFSSLAANVTRIMIKPLKIGMPMGWLNTGKKLKLIFSVTT